MIWHPAYIRLIGKLLPVNLLRSGLEWFSVPPSWLQLHLDSKIETVSTDVFCWVKGFIADHKFIKESLFRTEVHGQTSRALAAEIEPATQRIAGYCSINSTNDPSECIMCKQCSFWAAAPWPTSACGRGASSRRAGGLASPSSPRWSDKEKADYERKTPNFPPKFSA
jgi:hypothetical protein